MRLRFVLLSIAAGAVLMLMANVLVDPFYRFGVPSGLQRGMIAYQGRMAKAERICAVRPVQIIIGGSKIEVGMNPQNPAWGEEGVYNLGLAGMPLSEMAQTLAFVQRNAQLKRVVIGLDFLMFNQLREDVVYKTEVVDFSPERVSGSCVNAFAQDWNALVGPQGLKWSARTLTAQHRASDTEDGGYWANLFDAQGFRSRFEVAYKGALNGFGGHGQEEYYVEKIWRPAPRHTYEFGQTFAMFDHMLEMLRAHGVDVRLFTEPLHARMLLAIHDAGLWPQFEQWKRAITQIASAQSVPLWDFEAFNAITEEHVTAENYAKYWWEPSHYRQEAGSIIVNRVLQTGIADGTDFGARLLVRNIDGWLMYQRNALESYASREPQVAQGVKEAVEKSLAKVQR